MMNNLEFICNKKIVKFDFDGVLFISNCDNELYQEIINSLLGKSNSSFFNRVSIYKNQFSLLEITNDIDLSAELKYGTKSTLWKAVKLSLENNIDEISRCIDEINLSFNKIGKIIDYDLLNHNNKQKDIIAEQFIKDYYQPILLNEDSENENQLFRIRMAMENNKEKENFIVISNYSITSNILLINDIIDLQKKYITSKIIFINCHPNILYHFISFIPVYFKYLSYEIIVKKLLDYDLLTEKEIHNNTLLLINIFEVKNPFEYSKKFEKLINQSIDAMKITKIINFFHM